MNGNTERSLPPIPGYEIRGRIGAGGGGTVYRAWHLNLRKDVIIKRIHDRITDEEQQRTEADILKNLHHPYLPQVFDYFVIDGVAYTVMDFIEGESLQRMLDRGMRFSEKQVLKYARQLTEAVDYLHSQRVPIIHGDIKPDNIMRTPEDNICLIDFNISGISADGNAYTFGFSPGFSAPEQHDAFVRIQREMRQNGSFDALNRHLYPETQPEGGRSGESQGAGQNAPHYSADGTEILSYGREETERLPGSGAAGTTENLSAGQGAPRYSADGTEILSYGREETEMLPGSGAAGATENLSAGQGTTHYSADGTEILSYGREETERLPGSGAADVTENLSAGQRARYSADGTEILSYGREETERLPGSGAAGVTEKLSGSAGRTDERRQNRGEAAASDGTQRFRLNSGIVINKRSDVYSCGATLYYLYTGEIFDTDRDNLLRSGTSEGFIYVLNRALQRDPARRFADGGQMRRALDRLHKNNRSYRRMMLGQAIVKILLVALILIGVGLIISGRDHWKKEMEQEYTTYIVDLNEYRRENDEDSFEDTFEAATGLFPDRIDAWYQKALYLYEQGKFETTADFIEKEIPMDEAIYSKEKDEDETESEKDSITVANLYSILGNAYFELGDYKKCENSLATAISYDDRNPEFYVTRAIALARLGDTEKAESLLEKAINLGVSDDNLNLARGEIAYARGNYAEAEQQLRQCTEETTDDYRLLRAAMRCAEAVNAQKPAGETDEAGRQAVREMTERSAGVLKDAAERLPKQYHRMILHQLSFQYTDAYARLDEAEYAAAAVDVLKRIDEEGFAGFETYCTMVNLYTALERYDEERELLDRMDKEYPDHHLIPLYYAMLTAKLESLKPSEEQDYSLFLEYYNEAERRIAELDPALRSSNEINGLESTYEELVAKGRL